VPTAHAIRRYRDLGLPIESVRAVLAAPDVATRDALVSEHLSRLQEQLVETQAAVASLQALLSGAATSVEIEHRSVSATTVLAISAVVEGADLGGWWVGSFAELGRLVADHGLISTASPGGLFADELFTDERGDCTVFLAVADPPATLGSARGLELPARDYAVAIHRGSHGEADRTYGALGSYVAEHGIGGSGPVRENYLVGRADTDDVSAWRTEICWPIS
jgi:hypothetical protein